MRLWRGPKPRPLPDAQSPREIVEELSEFQTGRVKRYWVERQFGFIVTDQGEEIFMHHSSMIYNGGSCDHHRGWCARALDLLTDNAKSEVEHAYSVIKLEQMLQGARVKFRIAKCLKGLEARSVKRI